MSPVIEGPSCAPRSGNAPGFRVNPGPNPFYAVEVATNPLLFNTEEHANERTQANFYASWTAPQLRTEPSFQLPEEAWARLRMADRLYYRVITSASPNGWRQVTASVDAPLAETAPSIQIFDLFRIPEELVKQPEAEAVWARVQDLEAVRTIRAHDSFETLVYLHRYSPRRPFDPRAAEWVVIANNHPLESTAPVWISVLRLKYQDKALIADHVTFQEAQQPIGVREATEVMNQHLPAGADAPANRITEQELILVGNLWVYTNLDLPPDGSFGGTLIVHRLSGILIYTATTSWHGQGAHLVP